MSASKGIGGMRAAITARRLLRKLGVSSSERTATLRQWLLLLWHRISERIDRLSDHIDARSDRLADHVAASSDALSHRIYDGTYFAIAKLTDRSQRWNNMARIRQSAFAVSLGNGAVLCRILGNYRQYVIGRDIGYAPFAMLDGFYEYHLTEFIARNVRSGMRVMDIGANFGYYTLLMADLVGPNGKVHAFEPNPAVAAMLDHSLRVNNFTSRATVDRRALWNCSGQQLNFHIPETALTNACIMEPVESADATNLLIETIALDDVPEIDIDFIKADIEGAEEKFWEGSKNFFVRHPDVICILEFNCARCPSSRATLEDIGRLFRLRCLDDQSQVRDVKISEMLESPYDWLLVLSNRQEID